MIAKAMGKRIAIAIMKNDGPFSYRELLGILRKEDLRTTRIPDLMRYLVDADLTWELLSVAKACADEARESREILRKFNSAMWQTKEHFDEGEGE